MSKVLKTVITVGGVDLDIDYTHHPFIRGTHDKGGGQLEPDEEAFNEVEDVKIAGTDISLVSMIEEMNGMDVIEAELSNISDEGNDDE